jgi:hypothetical protein
MSKGTAPEAGAVAAGSNASRRGVMGSRSDSIWRGVGIGPATVRSTASLCLLPSGVPWSTYKQL